MPISHEHKCIFIHIPKTGGTSIEFALDVHGDWRIENYYNMFGMIHQEELLKKGFLSSFLQHLTMEEILSLGISCNIENFFSFTFVRNPFERFVSCYSKKDHHMIEYAANLGIDLSGVDFNSFVYLTGLINHVHLIPQSNFVFDCNNNLLVDYVARYENMEDDYKYITKRIKLDRKLSHVNKSNHEYYMNYYNDETYNIIKKRYCRDFYLFGYET